MIDDLKQAHDLAIAAATITAYLHFDTEVTGNTPKEKRASFADYLKDEYESFLEYYQSTMK